MNDIELKKEVAYLMSHLINTRTLVGKFHLGRNDLCYCGSEIKFKHCCFHKHGRLEPGTITPETQRSLRRDERNLQHELNKERKDYAANKITHKDRKPT